MDIDDKILSKLPIEASLAGVRLLKRPGKAETAVKRIMQAAEGSVLGFDMELIPRFRKGEKMQPPPVLQVCYLQVIMLLLAQVCSSCSQAILERQEPDLPLEITAMQ
jgi:hypothetical protein